MDRASDSGSEGWGFESLPAYQTRQIRSRGQLARHSALSGFSFIRIHTMSANNKRQALKVENSLDKLAYAKL